MQQPKAVSPAASTRIKVAHTRTRVATGPRETAVYAVNLKRAKLLSLPLTGKKEKNDETIIRVVVLVCKDGVAGVAVDAHRGRHWHVFPFCCTP